MRALVGVLCGLVVLLAGALGLLSWYTVSHVGDVRPVAAAAQEPPDFERRLAGIEERLTKQEASTVQLGGLVYWWRWGDYPPSNFNPKPGEVYPPDKLLVVAQTIVDTKPGGMLLSAKDPSGWARSYLIWYWSHGGSIDSAGTLEDVTAFVSQWE
jgi:hypothetical protein